MTEYRKGLPPRPRRVDVLPLSDKGYPIPWFVETLDDGSRDFRIMSAEKWVRAVRYRLCWICGEKMTGAMTFVAGPMCGINRTSGEPPSHYSCAEYAVHACPFMMLPKATRREAYLDEIPHRISEYHLSRNPGVTMLWTTASYRTFPTPDGGRLIEMGEPLKVEWWTEGRPATREEVDESIRTGLPSLQEIADLQEGGPEALAQHVARFEPMLPA